MYKMPEATLVTLAKHAAKVLDYSSNLKTVEFY